MTIFWITFGVSFALIILSVITALPQERMDDQRRNWPGV